MKTVTISIGRNINDWPMSADDWEMFRIGVRQLILTYWFDATIFVDDAFSIGVWNGIKEESSTFVASINEGEMTSFIAMLTGLAAAYEQDAIAVTVGETQLITPKD